ncbi:hypothetical protein PENTCL1PPCAC_5007, partial [Pristionchus entomophagus]
MSLMALLFYAVPAYLVYYVISYYWWVSKYPKGPRPYPIVGNLRQLNSDKIHLQFRELSLQYGPIFTVFMPVPVVVITSYDGTREAYVTKGDSLVNRPPTPYNEEFALAGPNAGVINANGQSWLENRRLTLSILRDFGMGKSLMEQQVRSLFSFSLSILHNLLTFVQIHLNYNSKMMIGNIITETLFGFRYPYDASKPLVDFVKAFTAIFELTLSNLLVRFSAYTMRFIMHVPGMQFVSRKVHGPTFNTIKSFIGENTERAMKDFEKDGEDGCFVHAYSRKIGSSPHITKEQMHAVCFEVFAAGQETTTTTLRWATLLLAANQSDKAREEILRVVGAERLPSLADKQSLPYTSALVHEVQRRANIVQVCAITKFLSDYFLTGHRIPAGTTVIGDIFQIMAHDPIFE